MTGGRYATGTDVPVDRSQQEITKLFNRYDVSSYSFGLSPGYASVSFTFKDLPILVRIPIPLAPKQERVMNENNRMVQAKPRWEQEVKECWRALVLVLKANLEAVERQILSPEAAFLAYIETGGGRVIGDAVIPQIAERRKALEA